VTALWLRLRYFLRQALGSMRQSPWVQLVAVSTIGLSLMVLGAFLMVLGNVDHLSRAWGQQVRLVAFLNEGVSATDRDALQRAVAAWPEVASLTVRSPEEALAEFKAELGGDAALVEGIGPELMPASLEIVLWPEHRNETTLARLAERLQGLPEMAAVDDVAYGQDILQKLRGLRDILRLAGLVVTGLVALAVIFIVSNTVRLAMFARREEIEIMHLVGATEGFIRAPFYVEGALQGLLGAGLATGLLYLAWRLLVPEGDPAIRLDLGRLPFDFLPWRATVALAIGAGLVGVLASHVSVGGFLKQRGGGA
jgi:cell division transport system permease protein